MDTNRIPSKITTMGASFLLIEKFLPVPKRLNIIISANKGPLGNIRDPPLIKIAENKTTLRKKVAVFKNKLFN